MQRAISLRRIKASHLLCQKLSYICKVKKTTLCHRIQHRHNLKTIQGAIKLVLTVTSLSLSLSHTHGLQSSVTDICHDVVTSSSKCKVGDAIKIWRKCELWTLIDQYEAPPLLKYVGA